jgi:hypothetical protein
MLFSRSGCTQGFNTFKNALKGGVLNPFGTNKKVCMPVLLFAGLFFLGAQEPVSYVGSYMVEKDIETADSTFPLYSSFSDRRYDYTLDEMFYTSLIMRPVGWTRDGLFSGQYIDLYRKVMRLLVADTITDETVGEWQVDLSDKKMTAIHNENREYQSWNIDTLTDEQNDPSGRLKANRFLVDVDAAIDDSNVLPPEPFPFRNGSSRYTCWFSYTIEKTKAEGARSVIKWKLYAGNNGKSKMISSGEDLTRDTCISGRKITRFYKSPFENRIVVVVQRVTLYGEISLEYLDYYGCHLDLGFK